MAIYHCSFKMITRTAGRSAINCAAYRSGQKLYDEELDQTFDYTRKGGVVYSEISLCENAPERYLDRETLWNAVQAIESNSNAQLAREYEVALPLECTQEEWIEIGREYAAYMTAQGKCVDWSIHNPIDKVTGIADNPHIHGMETVRPINENGEWAYKMTRSYVLDNLGERTPVFDKNKLKEFEESHHMTYSEAIKAAKTAEERDEIKREVQKIGARNRREWQRKVTSRNPWDSHDKAEEWRAEWAKIVNKHLEPERRIDHRSYERQGLDIEPTIHEGYAVQQLDRDLMASKGIHADIVQHNIDVRERNSLKQQIRELEQRLIQQLKERLESIKAELEAKAKDIKANVEMILKSRIVEDQDHTFKVIYRGATGKYEPVKEGFKTRIEAEKWRREIKNIGLKLGIEQTMTRTQGIKY